MNQRIDTLDFARGISVFIMIAVHTLWMYADSQVQSASAFGMVVHVLGKGTASFLVAMGISLALSRRQSSQALMIRGAALLALAFLMNWLKFIVPISVFGTMPESFIAAYGWQSPLSQTQLHFMLLTGDILQLAGLSLMVIALLIKLPLTRVHILIVAGLVALMSQWLRGITLEAPFTYVSQLFFADTYQVYFPVFPWLSAILVGYYLGRFYVENNLTAAGLFKQGGKLGVVLLLLGTALCIYDFKGQFANFFHLNLGGISYLVGLNLCLLWVAQRYLMPRLPVQLKAICAYASRHVTALYIIQWVMICWGMGIVGYATLSATHTLLMMPVMLTLTFAVHWLMRKVFSWVTRVFRSLYAKRKARIV